MTDADDLDVLLRALFETFGATPTAGQILGYRMALEDVSLEDLEHGVRRAMKEAKFLPKPVELRELSGQITLAARAVLAWGAVKKAVHTLTAYGSVDFADPAINATIRNMGGWVPFCGRDADTFDTFTRKDFLATYQLLAQQQLGDSGRFLPGINGDPQPRRLFPVGYPVEARRALEANQNGAQGYIAALAEEKAG